MKTKRFLLFASQAYSIPILRPLHKVMRQQGYAVHWYLSSDLSSLLLPDESVLESGKAVNQFDPDAVFSASNWVPLIFPGIKVQVFHGFNVEKRDANKGHFRIRGMFDLYCTQGPTTTEPFQRLAEKHRYFKVAETGWPKMDPLFAPGDELTAITFKNAQLPVVMFASTFTLTLSASPHLYSTIKTLIAEKNYNWLLTLHPKTAPSVIQQYKDLEADNAHFLESDRTIDMLRSADIMICDTSSIVSEFLLQEKPVVTFRTRKPAPYLYNITHTEELAAAIKHVLSRPDNLICAIRDQNLLTHPYNDGESSNRIIQSTLNFEQLQPPITRRRPMNLRRKLSQFYKIYLKQ